MSKAFFFLFKFVLLSVPLTWIWIEWGRQAYGRMFSFLVGPLYEALGMVGFQGSRERYINYIPFLVLMLITPRVSASRRFGGVVVGFVVILVFHLFFSVWAQLAQPAGEAITRESVALFLPVMLLSDALPFILWALICHEFVKQATSTAFAKLGPPGKT